MSNHWTVDVPVAQGGNYLFRYAVSTHGPDWTYNQAHHFGWSFMSPLRAYVAGNPQSGQWSEPARSFLQIIPENVFLAGMKAAEDGDGTILRLYEGAGLETHATISLRLPGNSVAAALACDARERNLSTLQANGNLVGLTFTPWETRTVRLRFR
jgi:alpha-mannosidase